jgi:hypothetical protein
VNFGSPRLASVDHELVYSRWKPDYSFAFVPKQLAAKGAHLRYGFSHCESGAWIGPDQQVTEEDHLIWMSANDISNALSREPQSLEKGALLSGIRSTLTAIDSKG